MEVKNVLFQVAVDENHTPIHRHRNTLAIDRRDFILKLVDIGKRPATASHRIRKSRLIQMTTNWGM